MIDNPNPDGSSIEGDHGIQIPFALPTTSLKFRPYGDFIRLEVPLERTEGGIVMPGMAPAATLMTAKALECGPKCELVKPGDNVLLMPSGVMGGKTGTLIDGHRIFFTQEKFCIAVVDGK